MKLLFTLLLYVGFSSTLFANLDETTAYTKDISTSFRHKSTTQYHRLLNYIDSSLNDSDDINRSSYKEIRKNKLQIILSIKEDASIGVHLRGNINLPQLKNKVELTFSQKDNQEIDNQSVSSAHDDVVDDEKLHVGLKYYLYRQKRSHAYAKLSMKASSPFGPYIKFGLDKSYLSSDFLETSFDNAFYYYLNGNKLSASTALSFFKPFNNDYWLGESNKLFWEGEEKLFLTNTLTFYQIFGLYDRITYKVDITTSYQEAKDFQHESSNFSASYFHRFDKWFFTELTPKLRKERENGYKNELLFTLNIGMLLGK